MRLSVTLSTLLAAATSVTAANCGSDNCLNQVRNNLASAAAFCSTYTTTVNTNPTAIPTYLKNCQSLTSRVSSACTCIATGTPLPTSSTSSFKTSTTSKPVSSTSSSIISTSKTSSISSSSSTSSKSSTSSSIISTSKTSLISSSSSTSSKSSTSSSSSITSRSLSSSTSSSSSSSTSTSSSATATATGYWLEAIKHQGISAFNANPATYQVFRNVKDFGAKGDGKTDDTAAINAAMSAGGRCAPGACVTTTTTPAIIYFPAGTYILSTPIIDYYYTQIIGDPRSMPVLKATANFNGFGLIDGDQYQAGGKLGFGATNVFWRQIRNLVFDTTAVPAGTVATGVHWPTSQATSLQNCVFKLSDGPGSMHVGLQIEDGSGGFMTDLVFYGGRYAAFFGNQQFTVRNLTFYNAQTAVYQVWDWGWTYQGISINNCTIGIDMSNGGISAQSVGSLMVVDSSFTNVQIAVKSAHTFFTSAPATGGSLVLENIAYTNTPIIVQAITSPPTTVVSGGSGTLAGWGQGHQYTPSGPNQFMANLAFTRPAALTVGGKYYARSKPQYETIPVSSFVSVRTAGAKGDGVTDDTAVINSVLASAASSGKIVFFDSGTYKVTSTVTIPAGSKVVGESYSIIMGAGAFFSSATAPKPVVQVGTAGQVGTIEWSDMVVSTQGGTAGAILIQYNLAAANPLNPGGLWDVHTRIGGFAGSNLQVAQCAKSAAPQSQCIAAFMSMYIAPSASGVYLENTWFWTADHDMEDQSVTQISVYTGRGLYCASTAGSIWMYGTSVEHHDLYQYQFANTQNIYAGQIQTETPYWQPSPQAGAVTPVVAGWNDPNFATSCAGVAGTCAMSWGLRIINTSNIFIDGAGLYSFFNTYSTSCSDPISGQPGNSGLCQSRIFSIEGSGSKVEVYNLNTIGAASMITRDGTSLANFGDNMNVYPDTIAVFRSG